MSVAVFLFKMSHSGSRQSVAWEPEVQSCSQSISKSFLVFIETRFCSLTLKGMRYMILFDLPLHNAANLEWVARRKEWTSGVFITLGELLTFHVYRTHHVRVILIWTIDMVPFCTWFGWWKLRACVMSAPTRWDETRLKQSHYYVTG